RLYAGRMKIYISVTPFLTIVAGYLSARFVVLAIGDFMIGIGEFIGFATEQSPFIMGILVAVVFGVTLTALLSSAALAIVLDISGLAAGAAVIGCCCHMVGLAVTGYKDNGASGLIS